MTEIETLYSEWLSYQPLPEEASNRLKQKFMLEFNYNSNHIEGNTLTYGQTELLLLFGKVAEAAEMKDLEDMKAHNVGLKMMIEEASNSERQLSENFIRQLHHTLLREDYKVYRESDTGAVTSYTVHAGQYKTRPNSVITATGERFEYASPEETPALMHDLIEWYKEEEIKKALTPIQLAAVFHYRYIRIHPFEDGNGRIARLLVNYILLRHNYPMIVVKTKNKQHYLNALNQCDVTVGMVPSVGAHAEIEQLTPFVSYMENCLIWALNTCLKAAKGESIEEDDDFDKELAILERQIKQKEDAKKQAASLYNVLKSPDRVWDVLEYVYFPIAEKLSEVSLSMHKFFGYTPVSNILSSTDRLQGGIHLNQSMRGYNGDRRLNQVIREARSMWFKNELKHPTRECLGDLAMTNYFVIEFFDDRYKLQNGLEFPYGKYPSSEQMDNIVRHAS
ncbi:Fic family protein [Bacteroides acidifaciens]|uniref:Fic family protein n=1 Tax=Bacteroides acidifaciens TaxID=85831 RepID=UPI002593EC17|nr:Fic family protein [Bacteroides acidifaciens]